MQENQPTPSAPEIQDSHRTPENQRALSFNALNIRRDIMASTALPLTRNKSEKLSALKQKVAQLSEQLVAAKQELAEKNAEIDALDGRLGRVTQAWAELDEQADVLQERLALSEQRIQAHADDYVTVAVENGELQTQLAAAREELAAIRAQDMQRDELNRASMSILFNEVVKMCDESDLEHERITVARRLVEAGPTTEDCAMAVKDALLGMIGAWALEMKKLQEEITFFDQVMLPKLDARIGDIRQHKKAIAQLGEPDLKDWHSALSGRANLNGRKYDVLEHRALALEALETVHLALKKQSSVYVLDSSFRLAHRLVIHARDQMYYLRGSHYHDVESDLDRTFYPVQDAIRKLVASGKPYSTPSEESVSYNADSVPDEWRLTVPEPSAPEFAFDHGANPTMDFSTFSDFSSTGHDYSSDFAINPANGVPMNGGVGGTDWYGNLYGSDMNDPW